MTTLMKGAINGLIGAIALIATSGAHASMTFDPNAGFAGTVTNTPTIVGADLNVASSIAFGGSWITTSVPNNYTPSGGVLGANDMVGLMTNFATFGTISDININSFSAITSFMSWTDNQGDAMSFDLTTLARNTTAAGAMDLFGGGIFHYIDVADGLVKTTAASFRLTAQDVGGNVSASFSWGTPPFQNDGDSSVPVPGIIGLMAIGLLGVSARRKRAV